MNLFDKFDILITPNGVKSGKIYSLKPTDASGDMTFTRASTANRINSLGVEELVASGIPRISYPTNGSPSCPFILVEPVRTNTNFPSNDLSTYVLTGLTLVGNTLTEDTSNGSHRISVTTFRTSSNSVIQCFSVYVKRLSSNVNREYTLQISNGADGEIISKKLKISDFTLSGSEALTGSWANGSTGVQILENGDAIFYVCGRPGAGGSTRITLNVYGVTASYLGDGVSTYFVNGFQTEEGTYPTSRILTTTAAVTRLQDQIIKSSISSLIGQTEGTIFMDFLVKDWDTNSFYLGLYGGGNEIYIRCSGVGIISFVHYFGGAQANIISSGHAKNTRIKVAGRYKNNDWVMYVNGIQVGTDLSGTFSGLISLLSFGYQSLDVYQSFARYYTVGVSKTAFTNLELAALTT